MVAAVAARGGLWAEVESGRKGQVKLKWTSEGNKRKKKWRQRPF